MPGCTFWTPRVEPRWLPAGWCHSGSQTSPCSFNTLELTGNAKGAGQQYEGGVRQWLTVKHWDTIDVVCTAVTGRRDRPTAIVAGLPINGELSIVGTTSALGRSAAGALSRQLHTPRPDHPWPEDVQRTVHRFASGKEPVKLTRVEPLVVEVSVDVTWTGKSFRQPLRYLRARPDLDPAAVQLPEHLNPGT